MVYYYVSSYLYSIAVELNSLYNTTGFVISFSCVGNYTEKIIIKIMDLHNARDELTSLHSFRPVLQHFIHFNAFIYTLIFLIKMIKSFLLYTQFLWNSALSYLLWRRMEWSGSSTIQLNTIA